MENELINKIIDELKSELKLKYPDFRGIYLFGSHARGDFNENSDYDLACIFDRRIENRFKEEIIDLIYEIELKEDIFLDTHIFNINDINKTITPLIENIKNQ
jgi:predicted nucleotidyltransferase